MDLSNYPRYTIIMRGYTFKQADAILQAMAGYEEDFAVEMTLNTPGAFEHIEKLGRSYGDKIRIGAGTVRTLEDAKKAVAAGAQFLLGPHTFTPEMLAFAKEQGVVAVPSAMTPSEINEMFGQGADIVKVFPAAVVSPRFFKDVQAPLGKLRLMAVGGVSITNAKDYLENGATYLGLGSALFRTEDIENCAVEGLAGSLADLLAAV